LKKTVLKEKESNTGGIELFSIEIDEIINLTNNELDYVMGYNDTISPELTSIEEPNDVD